MPSRVLPLPDGPSSIVIEPVRRPPRSIASSSLIPKANFAPNATRASVDVAIGETAFRFSVAPQIRCH